MRNLISSTNEPYFDIYTNKYAIPLLCEIMYDEAWNIHSNMQKMLDTKTD